MSKKKIARQTPSTKKAAAAAAAGAAELLDQIENDLAEALDNVLEQIEPEHEICGVRAEGILFSLGHIRRAQIALRDLRGATVER